MRDDFYSFYGSNQSVEEPKAETEAKKSSGVQTRKLAVTNAPSASVPTPSVPASPLAEPDQRQINQPALAQQAQAGLAQAGPPQAPSAINAMSATAKDAWPYAVLPLMGWGAKALWDKFSKGGDGGPPNPPSGPTTRELIEAEKLKQAQIKTAREKLLHENFVAKNTLTESEQLFGRKAKDATELRLMDKAYEQQKSPVVGANVPPAAAAPAPVTPAPAPAPAFAPTAAAPVVNPPAPVVQPANIISTGPTAEAAEAPIAKAETVKEVTTPSSEKPVSKAKKPISPEDVGLTKQELGMKKHLLNLYGVEDYPASAEQAYAKVKEILGYTPAYEPGKGGSLNPEEKGKVLAYRKENIEGPKVNLTKPMKDILKKGGQAAAALAATIEFANAKTREEKANAGANLLGAVLPPGMDINEVGAPGVSGQTIANAYKLGSPYAQTEQAKLARLREKAGAGRGIAPPSAYMR